MSEIFPRRLGSFLAFLVFVVLLSTLVLGLISDGPLLESMETIVVVLASLVGFLLVIGAILLVGVLCAFVFARVISFVFS
ncbi:hypothetical protein EL22_27570 [Halostagnicola sp. A56]|uniref:hypothetical protein n=1 Tax=Halostagnicola sp. A56 TaxID=1495067 RepID=UPI00049FD1C6|nr:hypothetical protein [Halostagnicola sp. A56]KMT45788.1 hypothetical protein EL22_27570 [Halostagnicola sp. A56]